MKKKSVKNKNSMRYIYEKSNHSKYSQLVNIKDECEIRSNCKNFLVNYKIVFLIVVALFTLLMVYAFRENPIAIVYCIIFFIALFLLAVYNCTYKLTLDDKNLSIAINFQKTIIKTDSIANIYISREKLKLLGIPIYNYNLNIIYFINKNTYIVSLPLVMVNRKQIKKLFSSIETEKIENSEEEREDNEKEKSRKIAIYTITGIIIFTVISLLIAGIILYNSLR